MTQAQLMKSVSDDWRSLPARRRKKYEAEAKREKERYARDTVLFTREFKRMFGDATAEQGANCKQTQEDQSPDCDEEAMEDDEEGEDEYEESGFSQWLPKGKQGRVSYGP